MCDQLGGERRVELKAKDMAGKRSLRGRIGKCNRTEVHRGDSIVSWRSRRPPFVGSPTFGRMLPSRGKISERIEGAKVRYKIPYPPRACPLHVATLLNDARC